MILWWEWLILVITCIFIIGLGWVYYGSPDIEKYLTKTPGLKHTSLENFLNEADNGDLILLAGTTRGERSCRWATGSIFSHVGFLFRETNPTAKKDVVYIWEADVGQGSKDGPRVMALKDKLDRYHGFKILGWKKLLGPRPSLGRILEVVPKYSDKTLDTQMWPWVLSNSSALSNWSKDTQKVFCSELVAATLQDLKILDTKVSPYGYSPQDFHENLQGLLPPYYYQETIFVRFS